MCTEWAHQLGEWVGNRQARLYWCCNCLPLLECSQFGKCSATLHRVPQWRCLHYPVSLLVGISVRRVTSTISLSIFFKSIPTLSKAAQLFPEDFTEGARSTLSSYKWAHKLHEWAGNRQAGLSWSYECVPFFRVFPLRLEQLNSSQGTSLKVLALPFLLLAFSLSPPALAHFTFMHCLYALTFCRGTQMVYSFFSFSSASSFLLTK